MAARTKKPKAGARTAKKQSQKQSQYGGRPRKSRRGKSMDDDPPVIVKGGASTLMSSDLAMQMNCPEVMNFQVVGGELPYDYSYPAGTVNITTIIVNVGEDSCKLPVPPGAAWEVILLQTTP